MFLRVKVTKALVTDIYVEVPDDFDPALLMRHEYQKEVARITDDTTDSYDWDESEWQETIEVTSVSKVSEDEANQYEYGELVIQDVTR